MILEGSDWSVILSADRGEDVIICDETAMDTTGVTDK